jgi:hypothetical protein
MLWTACMWNPPDALPLTDEQRRTLKAWVAARTTPQRLAFRARIIFEVSFGFRPRRSAMQARERVGAGPRRGRGEARWIGRAAHSRTMLSANRRVTRAQGVNHDRVSIFGPHAAQATR